MGRNLMELKVHLEKQKVQKAAWLQFFVECVLIKLDFGITIVSLGFRFFLYFSGKIFLYQISLEVQVDMFLLYMIWKQNNVCHLE